MRTLAVLGSNSHANQTAGRLATANYSVRAWGTTDTDSACRRPITYPTPRSAATGAQALLTLIDDIDELREVLTHPEAGALDALEPGAWWLNLTPVTPSASRELGDLARRYAVAYQHTPLLGADGHLVVIGPAAGDRCARAACDAILGAIGAVIHAGTEAAHLAVTALPRVANAEPALAVLGMQGWDIEASMLEDARSAYQH
ncbi:NAD(P)-binding domain-containing protein [Kitasatospora sp. NPDC087314]|uniref:NAD(P)-binding domain-containing protein n=1 Tax=Kitasatospora sp. NPDC087314 TaxID=3364068 RepID=UPI00382F25FB